MKTFRDYESLIRECVKKIDEADPNWNFSVKSISKDRVRIRWTYLDYCEEKNNCFFIYIKDYDEEDNEYFITCRTPHEDILIEAYMATDSKELKSWQISMESAIENAIDDIAYYAHSRY